MNFTKMFLNIAGICFTIQSLPVTAKYEPKVQTIWEGDNIERHVMFGPPKHRFRTE